MTRIMSSQRASAQIAAAVLALCLTMILVLQRLRGVWLDEAASYWLSGHDAGLLQLARNRWSTDVHPPLFSALAWMFRPLLGESIQSLRLINLLGVLLAVLVWRRAARKGVDGVFLSCFAVLVASSPFFILYAAEFRSYFLQMALSACLVVALRMVVEGRAGMVWLALALLLFVNLHYYGCMPGLILIVVGAADLLRRRQRREAVMLILLVLASLLPLVLSMLAMLSAIQPVKVSYVSATVGLLTVLAVLLSPAIANVAILWAVGRSGRRGEVPSEFSRLLAAACALTAAAYLLLNIAAHNLLPRHLIAAIPLTAALMASLAERELRRNQLLFQLLCLNALILSVGAFGYGLTHKRWETNLVRIAVARQNCPATKVYALNGMSLVRARDPLHRVPGIDHVFALTYRLIASREAWSVTVVPDGHIYSPDTTCPSLLWVEHFYAQRHLRDEQLASLAGFAGDFSIRRLQRDSSRALLEVSARRPSHP